MVFGDKLAGNHLVADFGLQLLDAADVLKRDDAAAGLAVDDDGRHVERQPAGTAAERVADKRFLRS